MLTRRPIRLATFKCPRHPKFRYTGEPNIPASCQACDAINRIVLADLRLDGAERVARAAIARTSHLEARGKAVSA